MSGTFLGYVFNKTLSKSIPVYIAESGPGFKRLTGPIDTQITIFNMSHGSDGDPNAHYSVKGEDAGGSKVKGGHVQKDEFKHTMSSHPAFFCVIVMLISVNREPIRPLFCDIES
ncbi:hypothetical protein AJ79_06783 [Helicocarpus griseus UAMH5409]|uniref:Uncharacterized protein n=1 Tax=Helicocarpus griseus UAMH5409 TaxID=1447875 RepID=A0A2B7X8T1_9EURO|nr:hypothetical protein AJ79_06783 [Helicocarpus griseus UAMH5409]